MKLKDFLSEAIVTDAKKRQTYEILKTAVKTGFADSNETFIEIINNHSYADYADYLKSYDDFQRLLARMTSNNCTVFVNSIVSNFSYIMRSNSFYKSEFDSVGTTDLKLKISGDKGSTKFMNITSQQLKEIEKLLSK